MNESKLSSMIPAWFLNKKSDPAILYQDFKKITGGGFGEIYLAQCERNQKSENVVVKRLKPACSRQASRKKDFQHEAQLLQKIKHAYIPHYINGYFSEEENFIVMEYIPGTDLHPVLGKLPLELCLQIMQQTLDTLSYLHGFKNEQGQPAPIFHCDIKPKNILLTPENKAVLIDFSLAVQGQAQAKGLEGSYWYMPPERFAGEAPRAESDLFSLLLVFYELLTGQHPVKEKTSFQVFNKLISGKHLEEIRKAKLPKALKEIFMKGLDPNPAARFKSAEELIQALKKIQE